MEFAEFPELLCVEKEGDYEMVERQIFKAGTSSKAEAV